MDVSLNVFRVGLYCWKCAILNHNLAIAIAKLKNCVRPLQMKKNKKNLVLQELAAVKRNWVKMVIKQFGKKWLKCGKND